ncbi:sigma factor binding protein 1, chloroplastic-like [Canna indica]|uniref:Sigma factor binding protein 1, chloroplastic-like n=1 Tax=Canna indica TaxID=4628 RepID=A0AAQ3KI06_9LILI|nr:sigma factor binding protein 1, chloroplastic-like [Canna indica]
MEGSVLSQHRKGLISMKKKKKPVKVVYISNPMRVTTSATAFRALVQKLTGRDSDVDAAAAVNSAEEYSASAAPATPADSCSGSACNSADLGASCSGVEACNSLVAPSEVFDEAFDAQMLENYVCGFMSSMLYDFEPQISSSTETSEV